MFKLVCETFYLARTEVIQKVLPWQKPLAGDQLTPNRVIQSLPAHLLQVDTPVRRTTSRKSTWLADRKRKKYPGEVQIDAEEPEKAGSRIKERMNDHSEMET